MPIGELALIAACLGLNAFFSATETVVTVLSKLQPRELSEIGDAEAKKSLDLWVKHPLQVLTTIQIGKNLAKIVAAVLAASVALRTFHGLSLVLTAAVMTLLVILFGEMVPKSVALFHAHRLAPRLLSLLQLPYFLLHGTGIAWLLGRLSQMIAFGRRPAIDRPLLSESDLEFLISIGARDGVLSKEKEEMLQSVLEFSDTRVKEIMVPRTSIKAVDVETDLVQLQAFLQKELHSRVPVYKGSLDQIVGIFHVKDILRIEETFKLSKVMRPAHFVPIHLQINELLKEMKRRKIHMAVVVDEFGGTAGLVTLEDILEEIVGDIGDEYDTEETDGFALAADGALVVEGQASIWDISERLQIEFPEDPQYNSVGGFLTSQTGRILPRGSRFVFDGYEFEVLDSDERRIAKVRIRPVRDETQEADALAALPDPMRPAASGDRS